MFNSVFCNNTSCGWISTLNRRLTSNSRIKTKPKEISEIGLLNTGSHTARTAASNSSARVSGGTQPDSMCAVATRW